MTLFKGIASAAVIGALGLLITSPAQAAVTLDQACTKLGAKVNEAKTSGDQARARQIYSEGSKRVASRFNGATCPDVKAP